MTSTPAAPCRHPGGCGNVTTDPSGKCHVHAGAADLDTKRARGSRIHRRPLTSRDLSVPPSIGRGSDDEPYDPTWLGSTPRRRRAANTAEPSRRAEHTEIATRIEALSYERGIDRPPTGAIRKDEDGTEFSELVYGTAYSPTATSLTHLQFREDRWEVRRGKRRDDDLGDQGVGRVLASGSYDEGFVGEATKAFARGAHLDSRPISVVRRAFTKLWVG